MKENIVGPLTLTLGGGMLAGTMSLLWFQLSLFLKIQMAEQIGNYQRELIKSKVFYRSHNFILVDSLTLSYTINSLFTY